MPLTKEAYKKLNDNTDGVRFIRPFSEYTLQEVIDAITELEELKRYPTSEEVCKALGELTRMSVYYNNGKFRFHGDKFGEIVDLNDLPPHLISLIGRFYESLEKVGKEDV